MLSALEKLTMRNKLAKTKNKVKPARTQRRAVLKNHKTSRRVKMVILLCIPAVAIIITLAFNFGFNWGDNPSAPIAFDIVSAITALLGAVGIIISLQRDQDLSEAQFTVDVNMGYVKQPDFYAVYDFWDKYHTEQKFNKMSAADKKKLPEIISLTYKYFDFFEPLFVLVEQGIIQVETISKLFEYRFCVVANNWGVQRNVLNPADKHDDDTQEVIERRFLENHNYDNMVKLYCLLKEYKLSFDFEIQKRNKATAWVAATMPLDENDLWDYAVSCGAFANDDLGSIINPKNIKFFTTKEQSNG
ncbi:hypothetical protein FACS1894211_06660 [Clostridia bacterium]|nr:hypothetical protein FACS1894211_06660 [Clostridia bacterium]